MGKKITLKSSDGEIFEVDEAVAVESQTIKHLIEDACAEDGIPVPNVNAKILSKVIEFCKRHVDAAAASKPSAGGGGGTGAGDDSASSSKAVEEELKKWDAKFVRVDEATLFDLILAADYLNIQGLLNLTCQTVGDMMIKGKAADYLNKKGVLNLVCRTVADMKIKGIRDDMMFERMTPEEMILDDFFF